MPVPHDPFRGVSPGEPKATTQPKPKKAAKRAPASKRTVKKATKKAAAKKTTTRQQNPVAV